MGPAPESRIDHIPRKEDFTENWRHESQTSRTKYLASRLTLKNHKKNFAKSVY